MDEKVIRAWWAHRQGLDGSMTGSASASALERTGWQRSLGGVGPYLPLFARTGLSREAIDAAVADASIRELPSARGCMYLVPAAHYALALRLGQGSGEESEVTTAKRYFALTDAELDRLSQAVLDTLGDESLQPRDLKERLGGMVREFGAEGQKRGLLSTLPLALGRLEGAGEIRRIPNNGRLDQKRYAYARWPDNPLARVHLSEEEAHTELAHLYFRWAAPASLAHFQWFSGLSARAAKAAIAPLGLKPLAADDARLMFPDDRDALGSFEPPAEPRVVLTSNFDNIIHLRRDVSGLLAGADQLRILYGEGGSQKKGGLTDLQSHPIFDRGCLIGLWEYEAQTQMIVTATLETPPPTLGEAVARMEAFIRDNLGSGRTFSLDDPKRQAPRIAALRQMAS